MSSPPERSAAEAPAAAEAAPKAADARLTGAAAMTLAVIVSCELVLMLDATIMNVALPQIRDGLGFTPAGLSWVTNAFLLTYAGLMLLGGRAGDILGHRRVFLAGVAWLVPITATTGYAAGIAGPLLLTGAGLGLVVVPFNMAIMSTVDPAESGAAAGVLQTAMLTGASLGIAVLSAVYASTIKENGGSATRPTVHAIAEGMGTAFAVSLTFAAAALLITLLVVRRTAAR